MANKELLETIRKEIINRIDKRHLSAQARNELVSILSFLSTLEESEIPNDLEEAAQQYAEGPECTWVGTTALEIAFEHGAKWQKEQTEKRWLEDRDGCFWDGVEEGKKAMREQMLKEAVEGVVCYGSKGAYIETDFLGEYDTDVYGNPGDKVRIIIVKE